MSFRNAQVTSPVDTGKWKEIFSRRSQFPKAWKYDGNQIFQKFQRIENREEVMEFDVFRLVGFYVEFGPKKFEASFLRNVTTEEEQKFAFLVKKYGVKEHQSSSLSVISILVEACPFYVAEHLHLQHDRIVEAPCQLPRCLAFSGGLYLIPHDKNWETLRILWEIWAAYIASKDISFPDNQAYMTLSYSLPSDEVKFLLMTQLNIEPPGTEVALKAVITAMGEYGVVEEYIGYNAESFFKCFTLYSADILSYYTQTMQKNIFGELEFL